MVLEAARIPGEGPEGVLPGRVECAALHPAAEGQGPRCSQVTWARLREAGGCHCIHQPLCSSSGVLPDVA